MTSPAKSGSSAALLKDASRKLAHELNNAANGVAVNLEVVRSRVDRADNAVALAPFANRAAQQMEELTALQELVRSLLQVMIESLDHEKVICRLSPAEDAFEIVFAGATVPHAVSVERAEASAITLRQGADGVILSLPRSSPSSE